MKLRANEEGLAFVESNYREDKAIRDSLLDDIRIILNKVSDAGRSEIISKLTEFKFDEDLEITKQVVEAIREVIHYRGSKRASCENVRSVLLSSVCAPGIKLKDVAKLMRIYENRNYQKLEKYKKRRAAYMSGNSDHMSGTRYAP